MFPVFFRLERIRMMVNFNTVFILSTSECSEFGFLSALLNCIRSYL